MSENPQWALLSANVCAKLNANFYEQRHIDVIMQHHKGLFDLYDAFAFIHVHTLICNGTFLVADIPVGRGPSRDKSKHINRAILGGLDGKFTAEFRGGFGDSDGFLSWRDELRVHDPNHVTAFEYLCIPARQVPLEVGFTSASRTLMHLTQEGAIARWPYGHDHIRVLVQATAIASDSRDAR